MRGNEVTIKTDYKNIEFQFQFLIQLVYSSRHGFHICVEVQGFLEHITNKNTKYTILDRMKI